MNKSSLNYCFKEISVLVRHGTIMSIDHPHDFLRDGLSNEFSQSNTGLTDGVVIPL
jgi:hypothetical protein